MASSREAGSDHRPGQSLWIYNVASGGGGGGGGWVRVGVVQQAYEAQSLVSSPL